MNPTECLQKIFEKCFHKIPILIELLKYDPELATFCAVSSRGVGAAIPYFNPEGCKDTFLGFFNAGHKHVCVRFPSTLERHGIFESGIEVCTGYATCHYCDRARYYRAYSVSVDGTATYSEYKILDHIDTLETEISLSNRPKQ